LWTLAQSGDRRALMLVLERVGEARLRARHYKPEVDEPVIHEWTTEHEEMFQRMLADDLDDVDLDVAKERNAASAVNSPANDPAPMSEQVPVPETGSSTPESDKSTLDQTKENDHV